MSGLNETCSYFKDINCPAIQNVSSYDYKRTALYIQKYGILLKEKKILVLGCGNASIENELYNYYSFNDITLVDFSPNLLHEASIKIPNAKIICCDLRTEIDKIKESFDVIYSVSVVQYFNKKEIKKINNYLMTILNKNGIIVHFNVPDKKRKSIYRVNNSIVFNDCKYLTPKFDFVDKYSRWCERKEFITEKGKTTFITPSIDWERFDVIIKWI